MRAFSNGRPSSARARGGGSLTALPIAETDAGNLSAYIPTNLISITDGQIVLDAALFHQGQKPAVDVGLSVSRVGGKTQAKLLRDAAGTLRLDYAQFLELEVFTRFGGMPEGRVRQQLTRGARIRAILRQPQHAPLRLADEVGLMLAVQSGLLDPLPPRAVADFRTALPATLDRDASEAVRAIAETGAMDAAARDGLIAALTNLAKVSERGAKPMTERLADIGARIDGIRQLGAVVNALKGIAAARARTARSELAAVDSYALKPSPPPWRAASGRSRQTEGSPAPAEPAFWPFAPSRDLPAPSANAFSTASAISTPGTCSSSARGA